jgi:2-polyprenyl-3-methyl-5-hydroxy-6-metoxy-1,4-benzoquinol methylase
MPVISNSEGSHAQEVSSGQRFEFGRNWGQFLQLLNEDRIRAAEESLLDMLGRKTLAGLRFVDAGSGSGLFSLAARRLGAEVHSFDYDPHSVACTRELRRRYFPEDPNWRVDEASVLDPAYLAALGTFDIVYSWGVLHHTGSMWQALGNVAPLVKNGGQLFIAIYNDQGTASRRWLTVKRLYNEYPVLRYPLLGLSTWVLWWRRWVKDLIRLRPFASWRAEQVGRGMSIWRDMVDWVGGYPFEVAKPEELFDFYLKRGFSLRRMITCGGSPGCIQLVFRKD